MADQPKCLCIVARDRLRGSDFIAALGASLGPDDQLEIIVDRRSGAPSDDWDRAEERRQRPQVDLALRANGFAVVPAPSPRARIARGERAQPSRLLPSAPSSQFAPEDDVDDDDDEERLEAIRRFKRRRSRGLRPWLVAALAAVAAAAFVLSPAGQTLTQSLGHRASPESPGPSGPRPAQAPDASRAPQGPAVADKPVAEKPVGEKPGAEKPVAEAPAHTPAGEEPSPLRSRDAATATSPRDNRPPPAESSAPPRAATGTGGRERARPTEAPRPSVSESAPSRARTVPAPAEPVSRLVSPRFAGLPRVELSREPGSPSGTYAVRIVDPAGRPLGDAEVLLLARMPDGTVENVWMHFYPDHGTYRGALPPTRSSPVDLRVRVITGDKRVEIPLGP